MDSKYKVCNVIVIVPSIQLHRRVRNKVISEDFTRMDSEYKSNVIAIVVYLPLSV